MKDNWRVLSYCFTGIIACLRSRWFNGQRGAGMPTVCETNWQSELSTGWFQSCFHDDWLPQRRGNSDRICVKIAQGFTVHQYSQRFLRLRKSKEMYLCFFIIVTGRKCCCDDTNDHGKQRKSPFELSTLFFWNRSEVCLVSIHLADFRFCLPLRKSASSLFPEKFRLFFFFPNWSRFLFSLFFLAFPDWQVWCCSSMMVTCWLLPRPQTRQLDFVVLPHAYTYVHLSFFFALVLPHELLRL